MGDSDGEDRHERSIVENCCGTPDGGGAEPTTATDRWLSAPVLEADLPEDVRAALGRLLGGEPVDTLAGWITEIRGLTGGGAIDVEDLCHADDRTAHWGKLDGDRHYFLCFYDAVILSALADRPVDIRTESPDGVVIEARAVGTDDLTVTPSDAVFSFGIDTGVDTPVDGTLSPADLYAAVCPYVKAFPDADAYERWATTVPAATIAMPLAGATEVAAALVD